MKEREELQVEIADLMNQIEKTKGQNHKELTHLKGKVGEYKKKVRQANVKIQALTTRISKYEIEKQLEEKENKMGRVGGGGVNIGNLPEVSSLLNLDANNFAYVADLMKNEGKLQEEVDKLLQEHKDLAKSVGVPHQK